MTCTSDDLGPGTYLGHEAHASKPVDADKAFGGRAHRFRQRPCSFALASDVGPGTYDVLQDGRAQKACDRDKAFGGRALRSTVHAYAKCDADVARAVGPGSYIGHTEFAAKKLPKDAAFGGKCGRSPPDVGQVRAGRELGPGSYVAHETYASKPCGKDVAFGGRGGRSALDLGSVKAGRQLGPGAYLAHIAHASKATDRAVAFGGRAGRQSLEFVEGQFKHDHALVAGSYVGHRDWTATRKNKASFGSTVPRFAPRDRGKKPK
eukprot:TRINITY_DN33125_c0_g1_i1.p1 TRINITY_DN33125_c0_g1~~TRINITY_DN33125_c0_g1_i1.p1  ORF type:complete len:263 (-),score=26.75 TRINITY_DN33125_c0_g1_i1:241-1029(-)